MSVNVHPDGPARPCLVILLDDAVPWLEEEALVFSHRMMGYSIN